MAGSKQNDVRLWQERIENGQRYQLSVGRSAEWNRYKKYYRHEFKQGTMPVNIMFSILRSMVPQIYFRNPRVTITPRKPGIEAELHARIVQKLDNWLLQELMTKREIKKMITDTFFSSLGLGFHGYDSQFGLSSRNLDPTGSASLTQFNSKGDRIEFSNMVKPGMPWFLRARPDDVVFPWGSTDLESLEWVALRVFRKVIDLKADKKYDNTTDLAGEFNIIRTTPEGGTIQSLADEVANVHSTDMWVELWQIHDARSGQILALTKNHNKLLRKEDDELQIEGLPIDGLTFNPDPDYIYGVPDARLIEPQLLELMEIRTQAMRHRRIDILKGIIKKGSMKPEEIQKLLSEDVMAIAQIETETSSIRDAFVPVSPGASGILQDLTLAGEVVRGDVREMVGFSRIAQGEFQGKTHVSATETKAVYQSLNIRLDERRDAVADLLSRIIRRFNQQIFTRWTAERVSQVVGPDGAKWWLKYTGPQIKDEYDMHVEPEEGAALDTQSKKAMAMETAEIWAKLNQGSIAQGQPVPMEIQRLLFNQFESSGLDVDRLIAQAGANSQSALAQSGAGQSAESAVSPGALAQAQGAGR